MADGPEIQQDDFDPNTMAGLSNGAPESAGPSPQQQQNTGPVSDGKTSRKMTALDELVNKFWNVSCIDDDNFNHIIKYADPEMAKKAKDGFSLKTKDGNEVLWTPRCGVVNQEFIHAANKNISENDANAMIALAKSHGWDKIYVHGPQDMKEKLWLAVMRRTLEDQKAFLNENGGVTNAANKLESFDDFLAKVPNFTPLQGSDLYEKFKKEYYEATFPQGQEHAANGPAADASQEQPSNAAEGPSVAPEEEPIYGQAPPVEPKLEAPQEETAAPEQPVPPETPPQDPDPVIYADAPPVEPQLAAPEEPAVVSQEEPVAVVEETAPVQTSASKYTQLSFFPERESRTDIRYEQLSFSLDQAAPAAAPQTTEPEEAPVTPQQEARKVIPRSPSGPGGMG